MAERIDIDYDYAVCAWARHFNVSQGRIRQAVAAVGNDADRVREHLGSGAPARARDPDRPSSR